MILGTEIVHFAKKNISLSEESSLQLQRRSSTSPNFCLCVCVSQGEILPSYSIQGNSRIIKDAQGCSRMFQNVPECSRMHADSCPECSRVFQNACCMQINVQNVQECSRMFQNVQECRSMSRVQNVPKQSRMHADPWPECSRMHEDCRSMSLNVQECSRMFKNECRSMTLHAGP